MRPLLLAAVAAVLSSPAHAQQAQPCDERSAVVARLAERYGETLQSLGLTRNGKVLEVYASTATGTWTVIVTDEAGRSCLVEAGETWEAVGTPPGAPA